LLFISGVFPLHPPSSPHYLRVSAYRVYQGGLPRGERESRNTGKRLLRLPSDPTDSRHRGKTQKNGAKRPFFFYARTRRGRVAAQLSAERGFAGGRRALSNCLPSDMPKGEAPRAYRASLPRAERRQAPAYTHREFAVSEAAQTR
jgi:hypothetical protein